MGGLNYQLEMNSPYFAAANNPYAGIYGAAAPAKTGLAGMASAISPWATLGSTLLGAVGTGLTAAEQAKQARRQEQKQDEQTAYDRIQDRLARGDVELAQSRDTMAGLGSDFRTALDRALKRG